jgi:hydrogenase expression/formation protein HypE
MEEIQGKVVQLAHGGGGKLQNDLVNFIIQRISIKQVNNGVGVDAQDDGATIPLDNYDQDIVITADGHTVDPLFFPGGDLGKLDETGTLNDLIIMGARPIALTNSLIIEEGTEFSVLDRLLKSLDNETRACNVAILAGDTKIMPKNTLKGVIMATTGIGLKPKSRQILDSKCVPGSKIILTGSIGDHGVALMAHREGINLDTELQSDVASLFPLHQVLGDHIGILAMKDPTRGGVASALNEWAHKSQVSIWLEETALVIKREVRAVSEILGLDPLEIANEGKALICVTPDRADAVLSSIQKIPLGKDAKIIGEVKKERPGRVFMRTPLGGTRIIDMPLGEPIPRVC